MALRRIDSDPMSLDDLDPIFRGERVRVRLSPEGRKRVQKSRDVVERVLRENETVYGVNTGFGKLARERISEEDLETLQVNLLRSHACGVGELLSPETVRVLLLLRLRSLSQGFSGVRPALLDAIIKLLDADILPLVPAQGSVGASGDLAPLAHLALPLMGEGEVWHGGRRRKAAAALRLARLQPIKLAAKEGLALINGTQVTTALCADACLRARRVARAMDLIGAMTLEALKGTSRAFDARIHKVRRQPGQIKVAANLRRILRGSAIYKSHEHCDRVQDPYSLRCMPQVHGAARDSLEESATVLGHEIDAVTDNPLVFADKGDIISGGNFHAQPVAAAADRIAAAVADLTSISERRLENLVNPDLSMLPAFLTPKPGLNSGYMIGQVVAASLVSESKSLSFPAAVDSIPTSANKEDHVSMGPIAARKALAIVGNAERVVGIELLAACQGLDFETEHRSSDVVEAVRKWVRKRVPMLKADRSMAAEFEAAASWVRRGELLAVCEKAGGRVD